MYCHINRQLLTVFPASALPLIILKNKIKFVGTTLEKANVFNRQISL